VIDIKISTNDKPKYKRFFLNFCPTSCKFLAYTKPKCPNIIANSMSIACSTA